MAAAKLIVLYPSPPDPGTFKRQYTQDHVPMVTAQNFRGIQKIVAARVVGTADGSPPPFCRPTELHFPSMEALQAAAASPSAQKAVAHEFRSRAVGHLDSSWQRKKPRFSSAPPKLPS